MYILQKYLDRTMSKPVFHHLNGYQHCGINSHYDRNIHSGNNCNHHSSVYTVDNWGYHSIFYCIHDPNQFSDHNCDDYRFRNRDFYPDNNCRIHCNHNCDCD